MKVSSVALVGLTLFFVLFLLIFRPVPVATVDSCISITGTIDSIYDGGNFDIVFKIEASDKRFYINRGLEKGLNIAQLRDSLLNRPVTILYPEYWTPLDPFDRIKHISLVRTEQKVHYNEINL